MPTESELPTTVMILLQKEVSDLRAELEKVKRERDEWREHAALTNAEFDPKIGLIDRCTKLKERIRDLIACEGELGDLKKELAKAREENTNLRMLGRKSCELAMHYLSCEADFTEEAAQEIEGIAAAMQTESEKGHQ